MGDSGFAVSLTYRRPVAAFVPDLYSAIRSRGAGGTMGMQCCEGFEPPMRCERRRRTFNLVEIGDVLGMEGSSSGHGPDMCAIMLLKQSENSLGVKHRSVQRGGGMRETAVAPRVACLSLEARTSLTSNPKDPVVFLGSPLTDIWKLNDRDIGVGLMFHLTALSCNTSHIGILLHIHWKIILTTPLSPSYGSLGSLMKSIKHNSFAVRI